MKWDHLRLQDGVAYLVWTDYSRQRRHAPSDEAWPDAYSCSLQPFAGEQLPAEEGPEVATLDEALEWARARTSAIIVRPEWDPGQQYYATDGPPSEWKRQR